MQFLDSKKKMQILILLKETRVLLFEILQLLCLFYFMIFAPKFQNASPFEKTIHLLFWISILLFLVRAVLTEAFIRIEKGE